MIKVLRPLARRVNPQSDLAEFDEALLAGVEDLAITRDQGARPVVTGLTEPRLARRQTPDIHAHARPHGGADRRLL